MPCATRQAKQSLTHNTPDATDHWLTWFTNRLGIGAKEMHSNHRGEAIYTAEVDVHFPMLTVGDTLTFAARARQPSQLPQGLTS